MDRSSNRGPSDGVSSPSQRESTVPHEESSESDPNPRIADEAEKRGGLEPEEFQRELVIVTATVLILGIVGGSCLGMKIQRAEHRSDERAKQQQTERANPATPGRRAPNSERNSSAE